MKKKMLARIFVTALILLAILFPWLGVERYSIHMVCMALIWVIMTQGLNIVQGYTGYVSIAQSSFFGIGAYTSALLMLKGGLPFILAAAIGVFAAMAAGIIIGYPSLKTKGHYFSIITLAFCFVIWSLMITLKNLTGGSAGTPNIPAPPTLFGIDFSKTENYYYLLLFFALASILFVYRLLKTKYGRSFIVIRENEQLAQAVGISLAKSKLLAFVISATMGGLAGVLYAHYMKFINPVPFSAEYSMNAILAIIMGGSGTISGPILGSFMMTFLPEYLRIAEAFRLIIYALLLVLITIFMPRGIVHMIKTLVGKVKDKIEDRRLELN